MELPDAKSLSQLGTLDQDRVHLFVAGPGTGEAIVVHLPDEGWLLLDTANVLTGATRPNLSVRILETYSQGLNCPEVRWFIVTHPHTDHFGGAERILQHSNATVRPERVGVTFLRTPEDWNAFSVLDNLPKRLDALRNALRAWSQTTERPVMPVQDGVRLEGLVSTRSDLTVTVHHPPNHVAPDLANAADPKAELTGLTSFERNQLSAVVSIRFGGTHILLPGDLERRHGDQEDVPGWETLLARAGDLADHDALKIPHHGSAGALHEPLLKPSNGHTGRAWVLTPFAGHHLPRADAVRRMLALEPCLHITCQPSRVTRDDLSDDVRIELPAAHTNAPAPSARRAAPGFTDPLDPIWAFAFDNAGQCTGRWCGPAAALLSLHPPAP